jgi:hypothetical protein
MDIVVGDGVGGQLRQLRIGLDDRSDRVARTDFLELNENMSSVREAVGLTNGSGALARMSSALAIAARAFGSQ